MPTSRERIEAGIKARNLADLGNRSLESFAGKPQSLKDLIETASKADIATNRLTNALERLNSDLQTEAERAERQFGELTSLPRAERQKLLREHLRKFRLDVVKTSSDERFKVLKEIREHADNMAAVSDLYQSPVHMLVQHNLGGEARSRYFEQLRSAGPTELTVMAKRAVNLGDRDLAAAVAQRYDALSSDQRKSVGFSKNDLATAAVGADFVKASEAFSVARNRWNEALASNRRFEAGDRPSGHPTIRRALDRRAEGDFVPTPEA